MGFRNQRSDTSGKRPNLVPGEIALNRVDDRLFFRAAGKVAHVDMGDLRTRAAPAAGQDGAPLTMRNAKPVWEPALAPSSVVDGVVAVDLPPPAGGYAVPGFHAEGLSGSPLALDTDSLIADRFYVASDSIHVTRLAFNCPTMGFASARLGLASADGTILVDDFLLTVATGLNEVVVNLVLPRGEYLALLWTAGALDVTQVWGFRAEQGWDYALGAPVFVYEEGATADLSGGLNLSGVTLSASLDGDVPGEWKTVLLRWT